VSIGVPVYNGGRFLAEALDSALAQDYEHIEVVISDNASGDDTPQIGGRYAEADGRVRYLRSEDHVGPSTNFARVLAASRGKYFTWLAHDDLLSSPDYLSRMVEVLEGDPEVALCGCSMNVLDFEGPGTSNAALLEPIYPDKKWDVARRRFFVCPYDSLVYFAIYGVFRREVLANVPIRDRSYKGRIVATDNENPILAAVAARGRMVAVPELLRSYRYHHQSTWHTDQDALSWLDKFLLRIGMKWRIFRIALGAPLPLGKKLGLLRVTLANFVRHVFSAPTDPKAQIRELKQEILMLRRTCAERLEVMNRLNTDCQERDRLIAALQERLAS
jgi:glycosyltransferase involved in cell wall biosynthesis